MIWLFALSGSPFGQSIGPCFVPPPIRAAAAGVAAGGSLSRGPLAAAGFARVLAACGLHVVLWSSGAVAGRFVAWARARASWRVRCALSARRSNVVFLRLVPPLAFRPFGLLWLGASFSRRPRLRLALLAFWRPAA